MTTPTHPTPTAKQTQADRLSELIAQAVMQGDFAPGARLDEVHLAQHFGVSRTPVREALRHLATSGLIDLRPRRGAVVPARPHLDLQTMIAALAEMEATCARLSAEHMTLTEQHFLASVHDRMAALAQTGDADGYAQADNAFHAALHAGAHNPVIADVTASMRRRFAPLRAGQWQDQAYRARCLADHGAVLRAITARDAAAAHAAMLQHIGSAEPAAA